LVVLIVALSLAATAGENVPSPRLRFTEARASSRANPDAETEVEALAEAIPLALAFAATEAFNEPHTFAESWATV